MSIFDRIARQRLAPANKIMSPPEVLIQHVKVCACCGENGATHQFTNGDLYLKRLPHSYLCDACWLERESRRTRHNVANHKTVLEHKTVNDAGRE